MKKLKETLEEWKQKAEHSPANLKEPSVYQKAIDEINRRLNDKEEMTWEHHFNKLIPILKQYIAVNSNTGEITTCACIACESCLFRRATEDNYTDCAELSRKWLLSPYKPFEKTPRLTREEYGFLKAVKFGYIARDESGCLYHYEESPFVGTDDWHCLTTGSFDAVIKIDTEMFPFIKWEDKEAWSIKDLLKLEVEE